MRSWILVLLAALICAATSDALARTWTGRGGRLKIEAEYVETVGNSVRLRTRSRRVMTVRLSLLSKADQEYVKKIEQENAQPAGGDVDPPVIVNPPVDPPIIVKPPIILDPPITVDPPIIVGPLTPFEEELGDLMNTVKRHEENWGIVPHTIVDMGTFDARTGNFTGLKRTVRYDVDPPAPLGTTYVGVYKIQTTRVSGGRYKCEETPSPFARSVRVSLRFQIRNAAGQVSVTANASGEQISETAAATAGSVTIDVDDATEVTWTIRSGSESHQDRMEIRRPPVFLGIFVVPVMPVAIVYEPPPNGERLAEATYTSTYTVGTTTRFEISTERTETRPIDADQYNSYSGAQSILNAAADTAGALSAIGALPIPGVKDGLEAISEAFGNVSGTHTEGEVKTNTKGHTIMRTVGTEISTGRNDGGPGLGDRIWYRRNVAFLVAKRFPSRRMTMSAIGFAGEGSPAARHLKEFPEQTRLSPASIQKLLDCDPFVEQPNLVPRPPRFTWVGLFEYPGTGGPEKRWITTENTQMNGQAETSITSQVTRYTPGFLSMFGIGPEEAKTVTVSQRITSALETVEIKSEEVSVTVETAIGEWYAIEVYLDNLYGTLAFRFSPLRRSPLVSGVARDAQGELLSGKTVTLVCSGVRASTVTNAQGEFQFRSAKIPMGTATLEIPGAPKKRVRLSRLQPVRDLELKVTGSSPVIRPNLRPLRRN